MDKTSALGNENDNADANSDNIIFTIKDTKSCVPVVTLTSKDNQKLSKFLSKGFQRTVYWNEYKTKSENKNTANEYIYFLKSNFVGVNILFALINSNQNDRFKRFNGKKYYLIKGIIKNGNYHQWKKLL